MNKAVTPESLEARTLFAFAATAVILPPPVLPPLVPPPINVDLNRTSVAKVGRELRVDGGIDADTILLNRSGVALYVSCDSGDHRFVIADLDLIRINGHSGDDTIRCSPGLSIPMVVDGGLGNDAVGGGQVADTVRGGDGNDRFIHTPGADVYQGGAGHDTFDMSGWTAPVFISLDGAAGDGPAGEGDNVFPDVEEVRGGSGNDVLVAGPNPVRFYGDSGDDHLTGGPGNDVLDGGTGGDRLSGLGGNDSLVGGGGHDAAYGGPGTDAYGAGGAGVTSGILVMGGGNGVPAGSRAHVARLSAGDVETIVGTAFADEIRGSFRGETIYAGAGNDVVHGGGGDDVVHAGDGADTAFGGAGADLLRGEGGNDVLVAVGGGEADRLDGGTGDDVVWADDDATELVVGIRSANERRNHFVNRVARYNNGAGLEPTGGRLPDPGITDRAARYADFSARPVFAQPASLNDINQGLLGNCWWMAAAGGIAQRNPDYLRGVVVPLGDGTFGVRLDEQFYRVDGDLPVMADGTLAYARFARGEGIWVGLMEKAMVQHRATAQSLSHNNYGRLASGTAGEGFGNFGLEDQNKMYPFWQQDDFDWVLGQMGERRAVAVSIGAVFGDSQLKPQHVYNVVNAWRSRAGLEYVTIRNPWGIDHDDARKANGPNDGYLTMRFGDVNSSASEWVACRAAY